MARQAAWADRMLRATSAAQQVKEKTRADTKKGVTIARNALI
jgi:hypothetical protein